MRLESVVRMHGWAINHRTTSHDLAFSPAPSHDHLCAMPPHLPHQELDSNNPEDTHWRLEGKPCINRRKRVKRYKTPIKRMQDRAESQMQRTYLLLAAFAAFRVGCRVESFVRCFTGPPIRDPTCLAHQNKAMLQLAPPPVRFDSDSYPIGVDNHASRCMANAPHLFEDLHLNEDKGQVDGINSGLDIAEQGTFKFSITDDDGKSHLIKIPNSLYVAKLRMCLLSPQHWAQEAGDEQTWMGNYRDRCVLNWKGGKKTVPFQPMTNVPVFYMAPSSCSYCVFTATFDAMEAPNF
jgi:hypothetical protein